tara:strand:+ start:333 stop:581 length:249 start_codon:yes stop_codon:yes gene_type:complete
MDRTPTYLPIAHIVDVIDFTDCPCSIQVWEQVCDILEDMGVSDEHIDEYMWKYEYALDFNYDYHDYHAEWSRGYEASIRGWA